MKKIINTKAAPAAIGPYSQGVSFGNLVMTSGQLPLDPTTMAFPEFHWYGHAKSTLEMIICAIFFINALC